MSLSDQEISELEGLFFGGQFVELEARAAQLTKAFPSMGLAWSILGAALVAQRKPACEALAFAARLLPSDAQAQLQYADALLESGQSYEAIAAYQFAIVLRPDWAVTHNNLGNAFKALDQLQSARREYELALQCDPHFALAHFNLAILDRDELRLDEAEERLRQALRFDPTLAIAWVELGGLLKETGDLVAAESSLAKAVELSPGLMEARLNLALVLLLLGDADDAVQVLQTTIAMQPTFAPAHLRLGLALSAIGRRSEARTSVEHALSLQGDLDEGYRFLADIACEEGRTEESIALLEKVVERDPNNVSACSTLLFLRAQAPTCSVRELFLEHVSFGELLDRQLGPFRLPSAGLAQDAQGHLRVGLVSGDFNNHIVGRALLPVIKHLSRMEDLQLLAYSNSSEEDDWTDQLRPHFASWHRTAGMSPYALARRIRADGVDVLIDLAGHTPMNSLEAFSLKAAPVQISWLGYTWTTGLRQMDYYFADPCWLTPGEFDQFFVEKLIYLPAFLPFQPPEDSPAVNDLPSLSGSPFTFGSFNHPRKLSPSVVDTWINILSQVPKSRLLLGAVADGPTKEKILSTCLRAGIGPDRLLFVPRCNPFDYLLLHHKVDLCLDAFPYPSATTIQHALWMGVPTVTLTGATPVSRAGAAVMQHVGLHEYVVEDRDAYVAQAVAVAYHRDRLSHLRRELRHKFESSALCQPESIADGIHAALIRVWSRHLQCAPADSFSVV